MKKIKIADGIMASELALGTASFGTGISEDESFALIDRFIEYGGNVLDTASVYGDFQPPNRHLSEKTIGKWLKDKPASVRDNVLIATKGAHPLPGTPMTMPRLSKTEIENDINSSLECLGVDYIDIYWLHRDDTRRGVEEIMETLAGIVKSGKARCLGVSNWRADRIKAANEHAAQNGLPKICTSQIEYSLAQVNLEAIDSTLVVMDEKEFAFYRDEKMPVFAFTAQAKGYFDKLAADKLNEMTIKRYTNDINSRNFEILKNLSESNGRGLTQNSIAWLRSNPCFEVIPIVGCRTIAQLEDSVGGIGYKVDFAAFESVYQKA